MIPISVGELRDHFLKLAENHKWSTISNHLDGNCRHKASSPADYLKSFLRISRCFGYATRDGEWGEFEKEFKIIVLRMIKAEQDLKEKNISEISTNILIAELEKRNGVFLYTYIERGEDTNNKDNINFDLHEAIHGPAKILVIPDILEVSDAGKTEVQQDQ